MSAETDQAPLRLCCFQRHYGPVCPDGKVMCELCFDRFAISDLHVTVDGTPEDVCKVCAEADEGAFAAHLRDVHGWSTVFILGNTVEVLRESHEAEHAHRADRDPPCVDCGADDNTLLFRGVGPLCIRDWARRTDAGEQLESDVMTPKADSETIWRKCQKCGIVDNEPDGYWCWNCTPGDWVVIDPPHNGRSEP